MSKKDKMRLHTIPVHLGDWEAGVVGMDALEEGAYWRLTRALYNNGGTVTLDERRLQRVCGVSDNRQWKRVRPVVMAKFDEADGVISHARVREVIMTLQAKSDIARRAAETRHGKKPSKNNDDDVRPQSGGNANHKPKTNISIDIGIFEEFYGNYPATPYASRPSTESAWAGLSDDERAHAAAVVTLFAKAVAKLDANRIKAPQSWLNEKMFNNYAMPKAAVAKPLPDGGPARDLYDAARAMGLSVAEWRSWLSPDVIRIDGGKVYARNKFQRGEIERKYSAALNAAGLTLAAVGDKAPALT